MRAQTLFINFPQKFSGQVGDKNWQCGYLSKHTNKCSETAWQSRCPASCPKPTEAPNPKEAINQAVNKIKQHIKNIGSSFGK